jgi:hypothetical protein
MMEQAGKNVLTIYGYNIELDVWYRAVSLPSRTDYGNYYAGFIATLPGTTKLAFSYSLGISYFHVIYDLGTLDSIFRFLDHKHHSELDIYSFRNV